MQNRVTCIGYHLKFLQNGIDYLKLIIYMYYISHTVHMFLARHTGIKCTISFLEI